MDNDPEPVAEQKKEKPLNELLTSSIVDIYIGSESTHWPLHERLLCYHSPFLSNIFYNEKGKDNDNNGKNSSSRKSYGFPDEEDYTFTLFVGWLYSGTVPPPKIEKDVGPLLDLYLLSEKLQIDRLSSDVVDATREYYHISSTYPGLRRVQYIYSNTDEDNEMREMMVSCVARQLTTTEQVPAHWASALQRNGQLAVDIIRSIQRWNIEERSIPDIRDGSVSSARGRKGKGGFSAVVREGDSLETETTGITGSMSLGSNLGVESVASEDQYQGDEKMSHDASSVARSVGEVEKEGEATSSNLTLSAFLEAHLNSSQNHSHYIPDMKPHQYQHLYTQPRPRRHRRSSVTFKPDPEIFSENTDTNLTGSSIEEEDHDGDGHAIARRPSLAYQLRDALMLVFHKREALLMLVLWIVYLGWMFGWG